VAHTHENCPKDLCVMGAVYGPCSWEYCPNDDCQVVGHCACKCHSGKLCDCGYRWPRMNPEQKPKVTK
jgi:hypothetical protein